MIYNKYKLLKKEKFNMENINEIERKLEEQKKIIYEYCSGQISLAHILKGEGNKEEANEVIEEVISRERLYSADEVFFTGTAAEVTPIRSIDHRTIGIGKRGPISEKLQTAFFDIVEAKVEDKYGWLSYI